MTKKILVVYYSDSGNTKKVADYIANAKGATVVAVKTDVFGKGFWNYMKRAWCSLREKIVPIDPIAEDPSKFDLVVVGAPVWAGHVASPIRSFLAEYSGKISGIAFFVTAGGAGTDGALKDMRQISKMEPIAELAINDKDRKTQHDQSQMNYFATCLDS